MTAPVSRLNASHSSAPVKIGVTKASKKKLLAAIRSGTAPTPAVVTIAGTFSSPLYWVA